MTAPKPPSFSPRTDTASTGRRVRDPYADLLRDTRGLRRDQAAARDAWYAGLAVEQKEDVLFELEMLLKGLAADGRDDDHDGNGDKGGGGSISLRRLDGDSLTVTLQREWSALQI